MAGTSSAKTRFALLPGHDGENIEGNKKMKLTFSPASPFARKVRIAATAAGARPIRNSTPSIRR